MYIHERRDWPKLRWNSEALAGVLADVRHRQGRLLGQMEALGFGLRAEAVLRTLTEDVVKSSEIEGELLDPDAVRSSIARRLGMDAGGLKPSDRNVEGVVEMMVDATRNYAKPLTAERLFDWHASLFPTGRSAMRRIAVGAWRNDSQGPMQVVSGPEGGARTHFEAPAATRLETEMAGFLDWFNAVAQIDPVLKAGVAHLWFVTIHPFDDGNGRIARAIADLCLARSEKSAQRFYSMSAQIRQEHKAYYDILEQTQKGGTNITPWLTWFLDCLGRAIDGAGTLLGSVLAKARFWESLGPSPVNERQRAVLNRLLDGFEGKLTTTKWAKLTKSSQDTAHRDILDLVERKILVRSAEGGRSTSYDLAPRQSAAS
ncbi:MAG: Fic family protein [Candidatus Acidiferrales bacterium]